MNIKEKANWELTLKNILYYIEDPAEQNKMIGILNKYNEMLPDGKFKDAVQRFFLKGKKTYYEKVDYLIDDILTGKGDKERNKVLSQMLIEMQPVVEQAERTFWDKLIDLFKWS
jgi:hypothetical protein